MAAYWDTDLRNVAANSAYLEWFGVRPEAMVGRHIREIIGEPLFAQNERYLRNAAAGLAQEFDRTIVDASGTVRHTQSCYVPDVAEGKVRGFSVLITDITRRKVAEDALADETRRVRTILDAVSDAVICLDGDLRVTDMNAAAAALTGWTPEQADGRDVGDILTVVDGATTLAVHDLCSAVVRTGAPLRRRDTDTLRDHDGRPAQIDWMITPLRATRGEIHGLVVTLRDVADSRQLLQESRHRADHDHLTGLKNRSYLDQLCLHWADHEQPPAAVVFLDLDGFKAVNDTAGHIAGDEILRQVAHTIREAVRLSDDVIRMGGDEFAVLLRGCTLADAQRIATKVVDQVEQRSFGWRGSTFRLGLSAGIALTEDGHLDLHHAIERADDACYRAKRAGGHRAVLDGS